MKQSFRNQNSNVTVTSVKSILAWRIVQGMILSIMGESKKKRRRVGGIIDLSLVFDHSHARGWPTYQVTICNGVSLSTAK